MSQEELSEAVKVPVRRIQNYEQGITPVPDWFILAMMKTEPNSKGLPMNFRNRKYLGKVDKAIMERYVSEGPKKIAEEFQETPLYITNRAGVLRLKGVFNGRRSK